MVSQDKLVIKFPTYDFPLLINTILNKDTSLFKINEYTEFEIQLDIEDELTEVYIQDEFGEIVLIESNYVVKSRQYIPGYVMVRVKKSDKVYNRFFEILPPKNVGYDGLVNIRKVIETLMPGASLDFNNSYFNDILVGDMIRNNSKLKCAYLVSNADILVHNLNQIIKNPIISLEKVLMKEKVIKKQNTKSIVKNQKENSIDYVYNVKVKENSSCSENAMLYYLLMNIKRYIISLTNEIMYNLINLDNKKELCENKIESNYLHYVNLKETLEKNISDLTNIVAKLEKISIKINAVIEKLGLKNLAVNSSYMSARFFKNQYYYSILQIYQVLSAEKIDIINTFKNKTQNLNYKSTPTLFELFNYIMIKKIILDCGYEQLIKSDNEQSFISTFIKDNKKVEISYNINIPKVDDISEYYGLISVDSIKTTPDIVVNVFDENNHILSTSIIEVKCRWFHNIYEENNVTDVLKQLRNYYQFRFMENDKINRKYSIDDIICTYPYEEDNRYLYDDKEDILYLGLLLVKDFENSIGYQKLKDILIKRI